MSQYGVSYLGSKSKIAEKVCAIFPNAAHFYDLFGGGFAISHCMLVKRKNDFKHFHYNEIRKGLPDFIKDCISGKYSYENFKPPFVTREDFFANKENDIYKKIIWSFGNSGDSYIFGKDIEQQKKSMHNAIVFNEFDNFAKELFGFEKFREGYSITDKRLFAKKRIEHLKLKRCDLQQLERLEQLEQLQQLERLQQLQQLQQLEQLEQLNFYNTSYENVKLEDDCVVYCDIPYEGTAKYDDGFNHKKFYEWVQDIKKPVFISEYSINKPFMRIVFTEQVRSTLSATNKACKKVEKVYCNDEAWELIRRRNILKQD